MNLKDVKAITIPECIIANTSQTFSSTSNTSSNAWFNYYPTSTSALGLCKAIRIKGKFHVYGNSYSWLGVWYNSDAQGGESQVTLNTGSGWVETPFDITCYLVKDTWINNTLWNVFAFGGQLGSAYRWIRAVVAKTNNNNLDFYTQSNTTNEMFRLEIDSVELGVSKIEDSNGNIIWGSPDAFPYRRLEYIESTGTQAIDTLTKPARNSYILLEVENMDTTLASQQQGRGAVANNQRFAAGYYQDKYFFGLGNGWITGNTASSGKHTLGVQGPECRVLGSSQGYYIDGIFTSNSNTFPSSSTTWYTVYLFGSRGNTSGGIQGPVHCKLYYAELGYTSNNQQGYNRIFYPVQRKSDSKLGLYDIQTNTFYYQLVSGSDSNSLIAGPTVDEYWDMTAPE